MTLLRTMTDCGRDERGSALVIAIISMSLMLMLGLAALAMTDQQTKQSGVERVRESSFNLAEGALQQQSFLLGGKGWPKASTDELPVACTPVASANSRCPTPTALVPAPSGTGAYSGIDYASGAISCALPATPTCWETAVRDNSPANDKVDISVFNSATQPRYDANADGFIWVKSTARVKGKTRRIVALLKRDPIPIALPKAPLVAGALTIPQNGNGDVIVTVPTNPVVLRCDAYGVDCNESNTGRGDPQITPNQVLYTGSGQPSFVSADIVAKLVDSVTAYTSCPTPAQLQGIVVIALASDTGACTYQGNTVFNSSASPGIVIMRQGTLEFRGTATFNGMLLHLNEGGRNARNGDPDCVQINGANTINGAIVVEGNCGAFIQGSARLNFVPKNLSFSVTGVAGLVQNTWRELPAS